MEFGEDIELKDRGRPNDVAVDLGEAEDIIVGHNVHKTYLLGVEGVPALRGVTVAIKRGEFIVILGKSGGGKTSLLNIFGTIDKPTKGELILCGKRITATTSDEELAHLRLHNIGFVFQTFNLISSMTAQENVELPMVLAGNLTQAQIRRRSTELLERVGIGKRADHLPSQLSGGEQQRVTIARAIANKPDILLLDEPTGDLDTHNTHIILQLLVDLNRKEGITCVMVTHDVNLKTFAHRVINMMDGKVYRIDEISPHARVETEKTLAAQIKDEATQKQVEADMGPIVEYRDPIHAYQFHKRFKSKQKPVVAKSQSNGAPH